LTDFVHLAVVAEDILDEADDEARHGHLHWRRRCVQWLDPPAPFGVGRGD
jgi:hypothetical protein